MKIKQFLWDIGLPVCQNENGKLFKNHKLFTKGKGIGKHPKYYCDYCEFKLNPSLYLYKNNDTKSN